MANADDDSRPHTVGFKKPPRYMQFKPGESGNLRGRPKRKTDLATILAELIDQRADVSEKGTPRSVTKLRAAVQKLVNKAAAGDARATGQLLNLMRSLQGRGDALVAPEQLFTEADREVLHAVFARLVTSDPGEKK